MDNLLEKELVVPPLHVEDRTRTAEEDPGEKDSVGSVAEKGFGGQPYGCFARQQVSVTLCRKPDLSFSLR